MAITLSRMGWAARAEWSLTLDGNGMPTEVMADYSGKGAADFSNTTPHCDVCIKRKEGVPPSLPFPRPSPHAAVRSSVRHLH